ncbi:hypothetical protein QUB60_08775 [Microcoleus sp. A2-C5]
MRYLTQAMAYHGFWAVWRWEFCAIAQLLGWLYFQLRSNSLLFQSYSW